VLVVVALVGSVPVPIVDIVHVIAVLHGVVAAARFVSVAVLSVRYVRQRVLVIVAFVGRVRVTFVDVIGMSVMLEASVPAAWTMLMRVLRMNGVRLGIHRSPVIVTRGDPGPNV
jgi:hypothetical protein